MSLRFQLETKILLPLLVGLITAAATTSAADWAVVPLKGVDMKCYEESQPVKWSYCINTTTGSKNNNLVYHFHGRNGDATWWNDETYYSGDVVKIWREKKQDAPIVVTVSFGSMWFLTERKDESTGGLYNVFAQTVMKTVEARIGHPIGTSTLVGESMGGVNALMIAFRAGKTFSKVASLCPPLPTVSPFAGVMEKFRYLRRSGASLRHALMMLAFGYWIYPNRTTWESNDPVHTASRYTPGTSPTLYLSCGRQDDWGCMEGSKKVIETIESKGGHVSWHERPGGHCDVDAQSLAEFLVTTS